MTNGFSKSCIDAPFDLALGGEMWEGRMAPEHVYSGHRRRQKLGMGTDDEDIGVETEETGVNLPLYMIERL